MLRLPNCTHSSVHTFVLGSGCLEKHLLENSLRMLSLLLQDDFQKDSLHILGRYRLMNSQNAHNHKLRLPNLHMFHHLHDRLPPDLPHLVKNFLQKKFDYFRLYLIYTNKSLDSMSIRLDNHQKDTYKLRDKILDLCKRKIPNPTIDRSRRNHSGAVDSGQYHQSARNHKLRLPNLHMFHHLRGRLPPDLQRLAYHQDEAYLDSYS